MYACLHGSVRACHDSPLQFWPEDTSGGYTEWTAVQAVELGGEDWSGSKTHSIILSDICL